MRTDEGEAIVIGSGAGGMFTALFLAKLGFSVTVVEKNGQPGGLMRSYLRDGIECPVGVHYLGALDEGQPLRRIFDFLELSEQIPLERMGEDGVVDRYHFEEVAFDLPAGVEPFEQRLRDAFPTQGVQITAIMTNLLAAYRRMHSLDFVLDEGPDPALLKETRPLGALLDQIGCDHGLKKVLSMTGAWMGVPIEECPIFLHHIILASYLSSSWRLRQSGASMARAFVGRLEALGGRFVLGDRATRLLVESRTVKGVELASGRRLAAPLVIGAVHPKVVLDLLPDGAVKPAYRNRITSLRDTRGALCVQAAVPASILEERGFNIMERMTTQKEDGEEVDVIFYQLRRTSQPDTNLLCILRPDRIERWIDSAGERREDYAEQKERVARRLLAKAQRHYGPLDDDDARVLDVYTPVTIRDWVGSPGGSAYGVLRSSRQRFQTALLNRTAVKGLFLSGQSTMAPGIFGTALGAIRTVRLIVGAQRTRAAMSPIFER